MTYMLDVLDELSEFVYTHHRSTGGELLEERLEIGASLHEFDEVLEGREVEIAAFL
jgi:hypothetical protein